MQEVMKKRAVELLSDGTVAKVKGMIDMGGFDFSKTENDLYVISILEKFNYDVSAADAYLRSYWGDDYDQNSQEYMLEDVYEGKYHGHGQDYTAEMRTYLSKMIASGATKGCVPVDARRILLRYDSGGIHNCR